MKMMIMMKRTTTKTLIKANGTMRKKGTMYIFVLPIAAAVQ